MGNKNASAAATTATGPAPVTAAAAYVINDSNHLSVAGLPVASAVISATPAIARSTSTTTGGRREGDRQSMASGGDSSIIDDLLRENDRLRLDASLYMNRSLELQTLTDDLLRQVRENSVEIAALLSRNQRLEGNLHQLTGFVVLAGAIIFVVAIIALLFWRGAKDENNLSNNIAASSSVDSKADILASGSSSNNVGGRDTVLPFLTLASFWSLCLFLILNFIVYSIYKSANKLKKPNIRQLSSSKLLVSNVIISVVFIISSKVLYSHLARDVFTVSLLSTLFYFEGAYIMSVNIAKKCEGVEVISALGPDATKYLANLVAINILCTIFPCPFIQAISLIDNVAGLIVCSSRLVDDKNMVRLIILPVYFFCRYKSKRYWDTYSIAESFSAWHVAEFGYSYAYSCLMQINSRVSSRNYIAELTSAAGVYASSFAFLGLSLLGGVSPLFLVGLISWVGMQYHFFKIYFQHIFLYDAPSLTPNYAIPPIAPIPVQNGNIAATAATTSAPLPPPPPPLPSHTNDVLAQALNVTDLLNSFFGRKDLSQVVSTQAISCLHLSCTTLPLVYLFAFLVFLKFRANIPWIAESSILSFTCGSLMFGLGTVVNILSCKSFSREVLRRGRTFADSVSVSNLQEMHEKWSNLCLIPMSIGLYYLVETIYTSFSSSSKSS